MVVKDHHYQQYPQRQHDDRRQPVVGPPQGGRAGEAAGCEAAEAVRKAEASLWTSQRTGECQLSCPPGANG